MITHHTLNKKTPAKLCKKNKIEQTNSRETSEKKI